MAWNVILHTEYWVPSPDEKWNTAAGITINGNEYIKLQWLPVYNHVSSTHPQPGFRLAVETYNGIHVYDYIVRKDVCIYFSIKYEDDQYVIVLRAGSYKTMEIKKHMLPKPKWGWMCYPTFGTKHAPKDIFIDQTHVKIK